jgi:hypothetical protein
MYGTPVADISDRRIQMANELNDLNRKCQRHGTATVTVVREQDGFRHEHLSCGCTIEVAVGLPISVGDAVLFNGELFRVENIQDDGQLALQNNDRCAEASPQFAQRIGVDTLSNMYLKTIPHDIKKGEFVINTKTSMVGCVSALLGGSVRCAVANPDGGAVKTYVWPVTAIRELSVGELLKQCTCSDAPHHPTCPLSAGQSISIVAPPSDMDMGASRYFPSTREFRQKSRPREAYPYNRYNTDSTEWGWVDPDDKPKQRTQYTYKEPTPKVDSYGISTADLIKDEVRNLEKQQAEEAKADVRPLRTSVPSSPRTLGESSIDSADLQIKKRRGDW